MTQTVFSNERWADIPGYEGCYQVSDYGRVRSCDRYVRAVHDSKQIRRGQIIKPWDMPNGYLVVGLNKEMRRSVKYIHRLVASAFIPNPDFLPQINHKDEDKTNNRVDNLEWCTHGYNINYGSARAKISKAHFDGKYGTIPVAQILNGEIVATFDSASDAERATGISSSSIRKVCLGRPKFKTAGGYEWKNKITLF